MKATFEARVPDGAAPAVLDGMADIWCRAERWLYRRVFERGGNINAARRECRVRFGLTARQVSSAWFDLRARVAAAKASQKRHASTRGSRSAAFGRLAPAADLTGGGEINGHRRTPLRRGLGPAAMAPGARRNEGMAPCMGRGRAARRPTRRLDRWTGQRRGVVIL